MLITLGRGLTPPVQIGTQRFGSFPESEYNVSTALMLPHNKHPGPGLLCVNISIGAWIFYNRAIPASNAMVNFRCSFVLFLSCHRLNLLTRSVGAD